MFISGRSQCLKIIADLKVGHERSFRHGVFSCAFSNAQLSPCNQSKLAAAQKVMININKADHANQREDEAATWSLLHGACTLPSRQEEGRIHMLHGMPVYF